MNAFFSDWVAVGFSPSNLGDFVGSDFCVFWADWKDNVFLQVQFRAFPIFPRKLIFRDKFVDAAEVNPRRRRSCLEQWTAEA